ncbi:hypothetical protein V1505DRAFT_375589 [Lipomyces doorenjongii]
MNLETLKHNVIIYYGSNTRKAQKQRANKRQGHNQQDDKRKRKTKDERHKHKNERSIHRSGVLLAIVILPDCPSSTKWLTEEEQASGAWRLSVDIEEVDDHYLMGVKDAALLALKDYKVYLFGLMLHANTLTQTFSYFFPTIVQTLGYNSTTPSIISKG